MLKNEIAIFVSQDELLVNRHDFWGFTEVGYWYTVKVVDFQGLSVGMLLSLGERCLCVFVHSAHLCGLDLHICMF